MSDTNIRVVSETCAAAPFAPADSDSETQATPVSDAPEPRAGPLAPAESTAPVVVMEIPDVNGRPMTRCQRAIFEMLCKPQFFRATVEERAKGAGVSKSTYHAVMGDPAFRAATAMAYRTALADQLGGVLDAAVTTASTPGRDGAQDRAMLLQVTGVFTPRQSIDVRAAGAAIIGVVGVQTEDL